MSILQALQRLGQNIYYIFKFPKHNILFYLSGPLVGNPDLAHFRDHDSHWGQVLP
jgi:hypothetical protein